MSGPLPGTIVAAGDDCAIRFLDPSSGDSLGEFFHSRRRSNIAFGVCQISDTILAVSGNDRLVTLWNVENSFRGAPLKLKEFREHQDVTRVLHYVNSTEILLSGSKDRTVRVWKPFSDSADSIGVLEGHLGWIYGLASFSSDGSRGLVYSSGEDKTFRQWNLRKMTSVFVNRFHRKYVDAMSVSEEYSILFTSSDDMTVAAWDARTLGGHSRPSFKFAVRGRDAPRALLVKDHNLVVPRPNRIDVHDIRYPAIPSVSRLDCHNRRKRVYSCCYLPELPGRREGFVTVSCDCTCKAWSMFSLRRLWLRVFPSDEQNGVILWTRIDNYENAALLSERYSFLSTTSDAWTRVAHLGSEVLEFPLFVRILAEE